ncbi:MULTISPECIES: L,D-transpeptidase family protein [unclassified Vibrio]|uniref:L,D-transpeptidase family protein n=1 Tax=unclassified Vibrio TaxID=2614977 RepID=UPI001361157E|nr:MULTISPECIES: L,D-transpeptidase family protein [unclassified Vibrio]NAW57562.1 L,D-transpeptidase family protein [Vibrio sp. V36_P2S2PM302]NAX28405.1 L,D-transpeptidase family protein [Vibrio sp. V38_P2S17PM301]NAX30167.1 L,D-transpeptidase family protein [Vibrio sp. V37_P2S8PM304]
MRSWKHYSWWLICLLMIPYQVGAIARNETLEWFQNDSKIPSLLQYPDVVNQIYQNNGRDLIWTDIEPINKLEFQLELIQQAGFSPLFNRQLSYLKYYRAANSWFEFDVLATDTLLLYMSYAELAPQIGYNWFFRTKLNQPIQPPSNEMVMALESAIESKRLSGFIDIFAPASPGYQQLLDTYRSLGQYADVNVPRYQQVGLKRVGDSISDRDVLLQRLQLVNVDVSRVRTDVAWYDDTLETAIKTFQRIHGLNQDGVIGPATVRWLNVAPSQRVAMLALNIERSRLWPMQHDTLILVNVPGYQIRYWYLGNEVFESKVVVGRVSRKTPVMKTSLNALILNPTWNVPRKIMVEDILPQVKKDATYLEKHQMQILETWDSDAVISPEAIDWTTVNPRAFPYRLRQQSGAQNALGLYKFNTPNKRAIYLHDTPSKSLFNKEQRAFSSGCIRVQNADEFAALLLRTQGLDEMKIAQYNERTNKSIPLRQRIPVHIIYQTVWYESGQVHYRDDIYRYDGLTTKSG